MEGIRHRLTLAALMLLSTVTTTAVVADTDSDRRAFACKALTELQGGYLPNIKFC